MPLEHGMTKHAPTPTPLARRESERNKPYIGDLESLDGLKAGGCTYLQLTRSSSSIAGTAWFSHTH